MNTDQSIPYYALSAYFRERFGRRIRKIPLDAGATCPNRDGHLSHKGCVFCNPLGAGTGMLAQGLDLPGQWACWAERFRRKYKTELFWAYLQSYSNTYGTVSRLRGLLDSLAGLPGLVGFSLGTRPDCLDREKVRLIAGRPAAEKWLDIGLQSAQDDTLRRINRGHDFAAFARAVELAWSHGLHVCAHVMHGLPGESSEDFLQTLEKLNLLPIAGVKLHNCYVARGSTLHAWFAEGRYSPGGMKEYVQAAARGLALLRPDIVIHRLNADPRRGELVAPDWAGKKRQVLAAITEEMRSLGLVQGSCRTSAVRHPEQGAAHDST